MRDIKVVLKEIAPHLFIATSEIAKQKALKILNDTKKPTDKQLKYLEHLIEDFEQRYKRFMDTKAEELKIADPRQLDKAKWIKEIVDQIKKCIDQFNRNTISYAIQFLKETKWIR